MNLQLPVYCEFSKFFIVEEIALQRNIEKIHYGKCNVIGYLSSSDCIKSLTIPNIEKQYQLPDCKISLKLFNDHPSQYIGTTVQVFGEVRLYNPELEINYDNLESSHSLIQRLIDIKSDLESKSDDIAHITKRVEEEVKKIESTFLPIIQVHNVRAAQDAKELINENLNFRLLQKKRDEIFPHHVPNS